MKIVGAGLMVIGFLTMLVGIAAHAKCRKDTTACCASVPLIGLLCR